MAVKDCIGQDREGPATILAPESSDSVGSTAKLLDVSAHAAPAFSHLERIEQCRFACVGKLRMSLVVIALVAAIDKNLERRSVRHTAPRSRSPGFRYDFLHVVVLSERTAAGQGLPHRNYPANCLRKLPHQYNPRIVHVSMRIYQHGAD